MSAFPDTPATLLARLVADRTGENEADWVRFFALYEPVIRQFAASAGARQDAEDVAQDIFLKLVNVFRSGRFDAAKGRFRGYLATMIRHEVADRWQKAEVRAASRHVSLDDDATIEIAVPSDTAARMDAKWAAARHAAAVEHVLTKTALAAKSKAIYRAYVVEGKPIGEVAATFGVSNNTVSQTKTRVERMIAEHEALLGE